MKYLVMCVCLLCSMVSSAQTKKKKKATQQKAAPVQKQVVRLENTTSYLAYAPDTAARISISDPLINAFNFRSSGGDIRISGSGVVGIPRGAYGVANGRLTFYSTGATSTGTSTGSGAVGTGTSPGSVGALGPAMV